MTDHRMTDQDAIRLAEAAAFTARQRREWVLQRLDDCGTHFRVVYWPGDDHPVHRTGIPAGPLAIEVNKRSGKAEVHLPL
jgi:hypothetical protein